MSWTSRRLSSWCTLVLFVASLLAPLASASHQKWDADLACDPLLLGEGPQTAHLDVPGSPITPEHCAVCHWLRAMGSASSGQPISAIAVPDREIVASAPALAWHGGATIDGPDTRGPPASL